MFCIKTICSFHLNIENNITVSCVSRNFQTTPIFCIPCMFMSLTLAILSALSVLIVVRRNYCRLLFLTKQNLVILINEYKFIM